MSDTMLSLSQTFPEASETEWLAAVSKALKGGGVERITRETLDDVKIFPLYREPRFASAQTPRGMPGNSPFLRGGAAEPDPFLPWDIRQIFHHPDPSTINSEILRDLERGVSSVALAIDIAGISGCMISDAGDLDTALKGVRADLATISLQHYGDGPATYSAALLAEWAGKQSEPAQQSLAFNLSPASQLMRVGKLPSGLTEAFSETAALVMQLTARFPKATTLQVSAVEAHEAGGSEAQELGVLVANAVDTLRRLDDAGLAPEIAAQQMLFVLSVDANYGLGIAKLRAARRLWARILDAMGIEAAPMMLHAMTSARMITRYDPWVNMLRGASACFAAAVGGADIITVRAFNEALGQPEELGRRVARNTQIIAMEECGVGRIADPSGGAWFVETVAEDLASKAWEEFQKIESEGGFFESLIAGNIQSRIGQTRDALTRQIARRKISVTGVSEFPLLDGVQAPVSPPVNLKARKPVDRSALEALIGTRSPAGRPIEVEELPPISLAQPFETLRDRSETHLKIHGERPSIFLATVGPLAENNARVDFARNLFAAGGIESVEADSFSKSGCKIAIICGSDKRYEAEAASTARALKDAGAQHVWIAGKFEAEHIDSRIFLGCDVVHECRLALAELGVK